MTCPGPLPVLHVLNSIERSGWEVQLVDAEPLFAARGIRLHALSTGQTPGGFSQRFLDAGIVVHHLPFAASPRFLASYWRLLRRERFAAVHVNTERGFFWYALLARAAGVRALVRTVHSVFAFHGLLRMERWIQRWLADRLLGVSFVAPSKSVRDAERATYRRDPEVVPNWVDVQRFRPARTLSERAETRSRLGIPADAIVFVCVGSCMPVKNHRACLTSLACLLEECPLSFLLHIGSGPLERQEESLARSLGLHDRVLFAGQRDDVAEALRASDVFLMTSTREGLPVACLEAMSAGLPTVALDTSGLRDLVVDDVTGLLVPSESGVPAAMRRLYDDSDLRDRMGRAARQLVITNFDMQRSVERYVALYARQSGKRSSAWR